MTVTKHRVTNIPVGRLVSGSCAQAQEKDMHGKPRENPVFYIGVAYKADDPVFQTMWQEIQQKAQADWANNPAALQKMADPNSDFAWKYKAGTDEFVGHVIVNMSTMYAPTCYDQNNNQIDGSLIKRGFYVQVSLTTSGNESTQTPGIYLNHDMIKLVAYGEEIVSGPSAEAVFGATAAPIPPGASATPLAPAAGMPAPATPVPTPAAPLPPASTTVSPTDRPAGVPETVQPHTGFAMPPLSGQ